MRELSPVQIEALRRSYGRKGFGYFLDMGLGKTMLAFDDFRRLLKRGVARRMVVVCPNNFKSGWVDELNKHGYDFSYHVLEAKKLKAAEAFIRGGHDRPPVLIVNYEAIRKARILDLIEEFGDHHACLIIFDESILLKNPTADQTKAALAIAPLFAFIRCLTGKPMTQGPQDLWAQLRLCGSQDRRNYYAFRNRFCRMGGFMGKEIIGAINADELQDIMAEITFSASKEDWLPGLPEKAYTSRQYTLGPVLQARYREMEALFMTWINSTDRVTVEIAITKYIKLAQIQCGFIHDEGGQPQKLIDDTANPRLRLLREVLEETTGKVAIVFKHRYVGHQLRAQFNNCAILIGGMTPDEIAEEKRRFNEDPDCDRILLQSSAGKFGHTLLGDQDDDDLACSTMVFYENSYSLDDRSQIEDRIHRRGQRRACLYVDFAGTPLDAEIVAALQRKQGMYETVMGLRGRTW